MRNDKIWGLEYKQETIPPNGSIDITVIPCLIDTGVNKSKLKITVKYGQGIIIDLKAIGIGSSVVFDPPIFPKFSLNTLYR